MFIHHFLSFNNNNLHVCKPSLRCFSFAYLLIDLINHTHKTIFTALGHSCFLIFFTLWYYTVFIQPFWHNFCCHFTLSWCHFIDLLTLPSATKSTSKIDTFKCGLFWGYSTESPMHSSHILNVNSTHTYSAHSYLLSSSSCCSNMLHFFTWNEGVGRKRNSSCQLHIIGTISPAHVIHTAASLQDDYDCKNKESERDGPLWQARLVLLVTLWSYQLAGDKQRATNGTLACACLCFLQQRPVS